jgi:hypothetical protein
MVMPDGPCIRPKLEIRPALHYLRGLTMRLRLLPADQIRHRPYLPRTGSTRLNTMAYRIRLERDGDHVRLITRGGYDWTDSARQ